MPTAWSFSEAQAAKIREHLLRGGFLVCDSFFGTQEWEGFLRGIRQIFPDREIEDVPDNDPPWHQLRHLYDDSLRLLRECATRKWRDCRYRRNSRGSARSEYAPRSFPG